MQQRLGLSLRRPNLFSCQGSSYDEGYIYTVSSHKYLQQHLSLEFQSRDSRWFPVASGRKAHPVSQVHQLSSCHLGNLCQRPRGTGSAATSQISSRVQRASRLGVRQPRHCFVWLANVKQPVRMVPVGFDKGVHVLTSSKMARDPCESWDGSSGYLCFLKVVFGPRL